MAESFINRNVPGKPWWSLAPEPPSLRNKSWRLKPRSPEARLGLHISLFPRALAGPGGAWVVKSTGFGT